MIEFKITLTSGDTVREYGTHTVVDQSGALVIATEHIYTIDHYVAMPHIPHSIIYAPGTWIVCRPVIKLDAKE